jgi:DNA-binding NarL/FixJ family response regulator
VTAPYGRVGAATEPAPPDTVTVMVADDHPPTRLGIRLALEGHGFDIVGEAATAAAATTMARELTPQVCLLDVHMPGNGITAARTIATAVASTTIVMLTVSRDDADLFDAVRAGASGYLLKDIDPDRLPHALRGVLDGEAALPRSLVLRLMSEFRGRDDRKVGRGRASRLTSREWEILDLLSRGLSTADIAEHLFVSAVTVRSHVSAVLRKLQVADREAAVKVFRESR